MGNRHGIGPFAGVQPSSLFVARRELGVQVEGSVDTLLSRVFEILGILALAIGTPTGL